MKEIPLTNSPLFALVDDEDFLRVTQFKWSLGHLGYAMTSMKIGEKRRQVGLHRIVMRAQDGQELDHINRKPLDCRKENLRFCTRAENCRNRSVRSDNRIGIQGICKGHKSHRPYRAYFGTPPTRVWKSFWTLEEAIEWRKSMMSKHWGEFTPFDYAAEVGSAPNATLTGADQGGSFISGASSQSVSSSPVPHGRELTASK